MAVSVLHSDARGFGLLSSIMAVGTLSGALFAAGRRRPDLTSLLTGAGVFGLGCTLPHWRLDTGGRAALIVIGAAALTLTNGTNSIMAALNRTSDAGQGDWRCGFGIALGGTPIGAPIVGWVAKPIRPALVARYWRCCGFTAALVASLRSGSPKGATACPVIRSL